jgi:Na+/citrate or Na+/malate symporter
MKSWYEPKPVLYLLMIVGAVALIYTGTLPEFVQGGLLMAGVMGFVYKHLDQRMPSKEEFLEMTRELIAEDFEYYLGLMNEDKATEEEE